MSKQTLLSSRVARPILSLILFIGLIHFSYSQNNFSYQDYFPKQEVDSVQWYFGGIAKENAEKIDTTKNVSQNLEIYFLNDDFPFDNSAPLLENYLEKRAVLKEEADIQQLIQVFPITSCESYAVTRCHTVYRDILIFYKNGTPVLVLKVCFTCKKVCFVSNNGEQDENAKCLSNHSSLKAITREWVRRGWIDLRNRER